MYRRSFEVFSMCTCVHKKLILVKVEANVDRWMAEQKDRWTSSIYNPKLHTQSGQIQKSTQISID